VSTTPNLILISRLPSLSPLSLGDSDHELKHRVLGLDLSPNPSSFNPYATSTQHQNYPYEGDNRHVTTKAGEALSLGFSGYNSQFDVVGQVDKVDTQIVGEECGL
jgi:hypothetical protein